MELTAAQRRIVEHDGGLRISGGPGCGKTTALVARYLRLVEEGHRPSSVLVVCADRAAASRFRDAVLPRLSDGFDALAFTTWFGVAFDLVSRAGGGVRLLSTSEQRAAVRWLLAAESPADWPIFGHFLGRPAFAEEVASALVDVAPGVCPELDRFAQRYAASLAGQGHIDRAGLLATAADLAATGLARYSHVLVDDHDGTSPTLRRLLEAVTGLGTSPGTSVAVVSTDDSWPAVEVALTEGFRHPAAPSLVMCRHPSIEPEAVAGELLAARAEGVAWSRMAVLVRNAHRQGRPIARALSRHGIPVAPGPGLGSGVGDPAVAAIVDMLRWSVGDAGAPGRLLVSPLSILGEEALVGPSAAAGDREAVTVTSITAAAGREWHTVVVAGCVEGALPRIRGRAPLFDPTAVSPAERRRASLAEERALFGTACSRATTRLVATAAPEAGILLSRFVEAWDVVGPRPSAFGGPAPMSRRPTANPVAVFPGGQLVLSASQLATYDDCPLRYAYKYGLRVPDDAGAPAALGSLVHEVLAEFLRPDREGDRTHAALIEIAAERWRNDIARYRPQVEECRRDYYAMLETWWAGEGASPRPPDVVAVEHQFDIEVGDIRLVGAIDRVDRTSAGDGIRIVDYKTGRREPRPDSMPDDLQLAVYHLAATLDPKLAGFGPPRQLQLLYLRSMHAYAQPIVTGHAEATVARVLQAAEHIRQERFEPSVDAACRNCSFHRLCPLQRAGREVGAG